MSSKTIMKTLELTEVNLKISDDEQGVFEGYASTFGNTDRVGDVIAKGAFDKSLESESMISGFINHDHKDIPVYDILKAWTDDHGLKIRGKIDFNHHLGKSLYSAMKRGAMSGFSIGFRASPDMYTKIEGGGKMFNSVELFEVSVCTQTMQANPGAELQMVKTIEDVQLWTKQDLESYLRDAGMSRKAAVTIASRYAEQDQSESDSSVMEATKALHDLLKKL